MTDGYKGLIVWQKAMDLVVETYRIIKSLPREEQYALCDQMRRAVISIPSNIAEGHMRKTKKEYVNFLSVARGSNAEIQTQLLICVRLGYVKEEAVSKAAGLAEEVGKMIQAIIQKLIAEV